MIVSNSNTSLSVLTEAYYGKPREFKEVEKLLDPIVGSIYHEYGKPKKEYSTSLYRKDVNKSNELRKIEKLIMKVLKIGDCNITFYGNMITSSGFMGPNAFTFAPPTVIFKRRASESDALDAVEAEVFVDKGLVFNYELNVQELFAIMLHELGHAMDKSIFMMLSGVLPSPGELIALANGNAISVIFNKFISIFGTKYIGMAYSVGLRFLESIKEDSKVNMVFNKIFRYVQEPIQLLIHRIPMLGAIISGKISLIWYISEMLAPNNIFGYGAEKYADSFATAYGYGVETAIVQRKFRDGYSDNIVNKIPVINILNDIQRCFVSLFFAPIDPHPNSVIRVYSQVKKLRRELNNPNIPKVMKKDIEAQLDELEKLCDDMTSIRANTKNGMIFSAIMAKIHIDVFKGMGDPREIMELLWRHEE